MLLYHKPAKVERSFSSTSAQQHHHHHHDHSTRTNAHHKEALRLALGSILAPKRPLTPMSRPSSGSATPAVNHDRDPSHVSLGWPQLTVGESAHVHIKSGCSSLPHTHSHSPSAHSAHVHPQVAPPAAHPPQTTHPHLPLPLSAHPFHPSTFGRSDLSSSTSSLPVPQMPQSSASTHPHSYPPSVPHSHPHSPSFTPSIGHPLTPSHVFGNSISSPGHSSGVLTPALTSETSSPMVHSPPLGPSSVPEEGPLQMLPPLVAATGSTSADGGVHDVTSSTQAVHPRPQSHPRPTTASVLEASLPSEMNDVHTDGRSKSEGAHAHRAGFIQTLQSKNSAWDALIHGSFS